MAQKTALVVGASRGIGRQIAIGLAHEGYHGEWHTVHVVPDGDPGLTDVP